MPDLGPQYRADDAFTARMRLHQSWYRGEVLGVECGVGPQASSKSRYGNFLSTSDGERGLNFLASAIFKLADQRQRELPKGIKRHRLLCNMLSSQPMAFNLFAPLALDQAQAPKLVSALIDQPVQQVDRVVFEYAPEPVADYLGDATAFDAFVEFTLVNGGRGFVGIETKLTEPFSRAPYPLAERPLYQRWVRHPAAPWRPEKHDALDAVAQPALARRDAGFRAAHPSACPSKPGNAWKSLLRRWIQNGPACAL